MNVKLSNDINNDFRWFKRSVVILAVFQICAFIAEDRFSYPIELPILKLSINDFNSLYLITSLSISTLFVWSFIEWLKSENKSFFTILALLVFSLISILLPYYEVIINNFSLLHSLIFVLLFAYGAKVGALFDTVVLGLRMVRAKDEAKRLALNRIPYAVICTIYMFIASLIPYVLLIIFGNFLPSPINNYWHITVLVPFILQVSITGYNNIFRSGHYIEIAKLFRGPMDGHEATYIQSGWLGGPIHRTSKLYKACEKGNKKIVLREMKRGADPDLNESHGWTPLAIACAQGHDEIVSILLNYGANPNVKNLRGRRPLEFACRYGFLGIAANLIQAGADVNYDVDLDAFSPLSNAAIAGDVKMIDLLLKNNADISYKDGSGNTAIKYAEEAGNGKIANMLRKLARDKKST